MLSALELFPREPSPSCGLPLQGRIILRTSNYLLTVDDVRDLIKQGALKEQDDPDESQHYGCYGF